jgi:DNA replication protein DnaC
LGLKCSFSICSAVIGRSSGTKGRLESSRSGPARLTKYDVLILDDFALRPYSHEEGVLLVDLIEDRYRKGVHIIISQVDMMGWKTLFEDPVVADALVDRPRNPSETILLTGGSYRARL